MRLRCKRTPQHADGRPVEEDLAMLAGRLAAHDAALEVLLFGSGARQELSNTSDIDLVVVRTRERRNDTSPAKAESQLLGLLPRTRAIDLLTDNRPALEELQCTRLYGKIATEGRSLWRRDPGVPSVLKAMRIAAAGAAPAAESGRNDLYMATGHWEDAHAYHRNAWRPYSYHRTAAHARLAARYALLYRIRTEGRTATEKAPIRELVDEARIKLRCGRESLLRLDTMRRWHFTGEPEVKAHGAYRALTTSLSVLHACGALPETRRPRRHERRRHP